MKRIVAGWLMAVLLSSCHHARESCLSSYQSYVHVFGEGTGSEWRRLWTQTLLPTPEVSITYDSGWTFHVGRVDERLRTFEYPEAVKGEVVHLPHRVLKPNSALWYLKSLIIPEPGVLRVRADDGAQVFICGNHARRIRGEYFAIDTAGSIGIAVRVLNNAMRGGLQSFSFVTKDRFRHVDSVAAVMRRRRNTIEKVMLAQGGSDRVRGVVNPAWDSLDTLERLLRPRPMLGPVLMNDGSETKLVVMNDGRDSVQVYYGKESRSLVRRSSGIGERVTVELPDTFPLYYQVRSGQSETPVYRIAGERSDGFSFSVWADSQGGWEVFSRHIFNTLGYNDAFSVGVGDLVSDGSDQNQWEVLLRILSINPRVPYYLIPGNHDYDGYYDDLVAEGYHTYTGNSKGYFGWTYRGSAFMALDLNAEFPIGISADSDQYRWFRDQIALRSWKEAAWRFVFVHQPLYSDGWEGYEGDAAIRELLEPWMEQAAVDFVVSGHTHDYERGAKRYGDQHTRFVILGGAGGTLEASTNPPASPAMDTVVRKHHFGRFYVDGATARFEALDTAGNIIDRLTYSK